ncbi:MAG TPA: redoxin domain-containing protein [Abditibacteriaceae bacterium]|nr:redoxin domain-containing protein [Abditibacteriaceae bacterium]
MPEKRKIRFNHSALYDSARWLTAALLVMASIPAPAYSHAPATTPAATTPAATPAAATTPAAKASPRPAPAFTLPATDGKTHSLAAYRGRSTVLFFYCGCRWCHQSAQSWSRVQRSGALAQLGSSQARNPKPGAVSKNSPQGSRAPLTLVVYLGDKSEAQQFAGKTQLDRKQTIFLADPDEKVSSLYDAAPCPRVFVVDGESRIRYTNNEKGADSYKIPAPLITARTLDALRAVARPVAPAKAVPAPSQKKPKPAAKDHR